MERYITSTELKQGFRSVKAYARKDVVHITENGRAAFVLCSSEVFERELRVAREHAVWNAAVQDVMEQSGYDVQRGSVIKMNNIAGLAELPGACLMVCRCASREIESCAQLDSVLWREQMLSLSRRPNAGLTLEYDGSASPHKIQVPPYDVIYTVEKDDTVLVRGIVKSIDVGACDS